MDQEKNNPISEASSVTEQPHQELQNTPPMLPVNSTNNTAPTNNKFKKQLLIVVVAIVVVASSGALAYMFTHKNSTAKVTSQTSTLSKDTVELSKETQKNQTTTPSTTNNSTPTTTQTKEDPFVKQPPEELTTFYDDLDENFNQLAKDKSSYITVKHPKDWPVYRKSFNSNNGTLPGVYIQAPGGKFLNISYSGGVGGDCQANDTQYTLTKKLPTQDSELFFTEYTIKETETATRKLSLEGYGKKRNYLGERLTAAEVQKHENLKEGEFSTNTCLLSFYPRPVGSIMITINDTEKASYSNSFTWNDIQKDKEFVDMLQSLKVYEK